MALLLEPPDGCDRQDVVPSDQLASLSHCREYTIDGSGRPAVARTSVACEELTTGFDLLRTAFVAQGNAFFPVVLNLDVPAGTTNMASLSECTEELHRRDMDNELCFGGPLAGFAIIEKTREQRQRLLVRLSQAQHDSVNIARMWNEFEVAYTNPRGHNPADEHADRATSSPLSRTGTQAARGYWRRLLRGSALTNLKLRKPRTLSHGEGPLLVRKMARAALQSIDFAFATVLKTARA